MKKIFYGCALVLGVLTMPHAVAQDCCYSPQYSSSCGQGFDGLYVGGNVGALSHTAHRNDLDGFHTDNAGWSTIGTSATVGLQLGYDWQCCNRVIGLVADWNWANANKRILDDPNGGAGGDFTRNKLHWFSTIRARAGLAISDTLVYVTLGAAASKLNTNWTDGADTFKNNRTRWGWTAGVGAEFMMWCNWSLGLEALCMNFSEHTRSATFGANTFAFGHSDSVWIGRVILNYRFGDLFCCN